MSKNKKHTDKQVTFSEKASSSLAFKIAKRQFKNKRQKSISEYVEGILKGDRFLLSQAITLVESTRKKHQQLAAEIVEKCMPHSGESIRMGITGTPGVGKSTFIESFGLHLISQSRKTAVLAIDPTSQLSKGSILGDKTRMEKLSAHPDAFIRPSPTGGSLGGVARKTRETILLCEAAGFDSILVETVGVGQSEVAVHSMVDFFLLLLLPGAGDELQGIKRGIVEMADLIAVNKSDGDREKLAKAAKREYRNALHLFPPKESGWIPKVVTCSGLSGLGIEDIWSIVVDYKTLTRKNQFFVNHRNSQLKQWLFDTIDDRMKQLFFDNALVKAHLDRVENAVLSKKMSFSNGANILIDLFREQKPSKE
ncbi:MAG: methylmalonyl Co-A mutase-associated GTPase MeaB [Saprospiraceae bacterium]|nr:methylmalonyl Co-A mutase-associated GTPase MeaB [Saprospiraceae bacterium]